MHRLAPDAYAQSDEEKLEAYLNLQSPETRASECRELVLKLRARPARKDNESEQETEPSNHPDMLQPTPESSTKSIVMDFRDPPV